MSKWKGKKVAIPIVAIVVIGVVLFFMLRGNARKEGVAEYEKKYAGEDLSVEDDDMGRKDTYTRYLEKHKNAPSPDDVIEVDVFDYLPTSQNVSVVENVGGESKAVKSGEDGYVEYKVNVPKEGLYNIQLGYFPVESRGISIERSLYINDEMPFYGADALTFYRVWTDGGEVKQDNRGNDIRPTQVEEPIWQTSYFRDYMGYETSPYQFYFKEGENRIRLEAVNEPLVFKSITIHNKEKDLPYSEYIASFDQSDYQDADPNYQQKIQGEDAVRRTSPSLYAISDRSSPSTDPYDSSKIRLNMVGGTNWKVVGDAIEWDFEVPEDGIYSLSFKARQSYNRGFVSNRSLYIDGKIPFEEVSKIGFKYNTKWQMITLSDENGEPYQFPLKKGNHTIRLEVTLGDVGDILQRLSDSVLRLNNMYRKILVVTGAEPDQYRDYGLDTMFPDVIKGMDLESKRLFQIVDELVAYSGDKSTETATALTLATQLERFAERADRIPKALKNFKENISALGTSINSLSEAPIDIDYLVVSASTAEVPEVKETFLDTTMHSVRTFLASFFIDYNSLGNVYEKSKDNTIDVWIQAGRDQSTVLKAMIDETFTLDTGINVNLKLVEGTATNATNTNALLNSVLANTGPDVALTVPQTEPVNYALRNAAIDLSDMEGLDEVLSEYYESAYVSYQFNDGLYALPETQNFNIMFYRTDILKDLGIEPPNTWQELIEIFPIILNNNLQVGVPSVERKIGNTVNPDLANYFAQLYQRGGKLYSDDGKKVLIDTEEAIQAFEFYTKFFTNYKLPKQYDFLSRFRTGEMPIGIADYNNFNTFAVFAPEIRGLWDFALMPGVEEEDGTINRATQSWGTCAMMLRTVKNKENAWKFLKWWASSETQVRFGRELESIMGAAARYATANHVAFNQLAWSSKEASVLKEQWKYAFGIPEIAGGYYTSRHITNAIRKVMNESEDARETLLDYVNTINDEIRFKRQEFGLEVD